MKHTAALQRVHRIWPAWHARLRRIEVCPQIGGEPERHRYSCRYMELFVWCLHGEFVGFELNYSLRDDTARSVRWNEREGLIFSRLQSAGDVLVPLADEQPPLPFIAAAFATCSRQIDRHTRRYVLASLLAQSVCTQGVHGRVLLEEKQNRREEFEPTSNYRE